MKLDTGAGLRLDFGAINAGLTIGENPKVTLLPPVRWSTGLTGVDEKQCTS
jgi:hypothetical protein